jgi:hypothetical protein
MPNLKKKISKVNNSSKSEEDALYELVDNNVRTLNSIPADAEQADIDAIIKEIVCPFYKGGKHKGCIGCAQRSETLQKCKDEYIEYIPHRPMRVWSPEFYELEVREKVKINPIGLNCDTCYLSDKCSQYKARATCSIDWGFNIEDSSPQKILDKLIELQQERISIARSAELMDGGIPDQNLSNEIDRLTNLLAARADLDTDRFSLKVEGTAKGNGGGILASLFGGLGGAKNEQQMIEAPITPSIDVTNLKEPEFVEKRKKPNLKK